jgi:hypothetical protein
MPFGWPNRHSHVDCKNKIVAVSLYVVQMVILLYQHNILAMIVD